jgi:acyl-CoA synthetase (AMP-forming)/AMP-acid ligase II
MKAAMQTFGNRLSFIRKAAMIPDQRIKPGDVFALIGPVTHATGMNIMPVLFSGGCNLVMSRFDPEELFQTVAREKVTHLFLVPTMVHMLIDHPDCRKYDLSSLKRIIYGAAPISPQRLREAIDLFGPILAQGYGAGETTSVITFLSINDHIEALRDCPDRLASCGRPVFDTEVKIVDEDGKQLSPGQIGEIVVKGSDVMKGYWKEPELTKKVLVDGWYHTGDLACADERGYLYIVDRKKDMIISGGFNVYPSEIENVLYGHEAICEVCVVGTPDEKWGEAIKAVVSLKPGMQTSEKELIDHCLASLGRFKKPQSVDFVDALPKNPNGKIVRRLVKEKYWGGKTRKVN